MSFVLDVLDPVASQLIAEADFWFLELEEGGMELAGAVPSFVVEDDDRPVRQQLDERYAHGGGWNPLPGFSLDLKTGLLSYPGDPPLRPVFAMQQKGGEQVIVYPHALVMILQKDGAFEVARMD